MSALYVESSALLAALLEGDEIIATALDAASIRVTSALTFLEAHRGILRRARETSLAPVATRRLYARISELSARMDVVPISEPILELARRAFPVEPVRSLDAIHLATLQALSEDLDVEIEVASHDVRVRENARALGFALVPAS